MTERNGVEPILRALWREKLHVEPQALELSPSAVSERFAHIFAPADLFLDMLRPFPAGLLAFWRDTAAGHVVLTHGPSGYAPGPQPWRDGTLLSVCYLAVGDLLADPRGALEMWLRLLDHLLGGGATGSGAEPSGDWFSLGAGATPRLQEAAQRFVRIEALGYGHGELGAEGPDTYFVRTLALYVEDPRRLSVLDPLVHKLYTSTLMAERFWARDELGD